MIFPEDYETQEDYEEDDETEDRALPELTDWALDTTVTPWVMALRDGAPYTITGIDALRQWIHKALLTPEGRFIYSDFGIASVAPLTDFAILSDDIKTAITAALMVSDYITDVTGFTFERLENGIRTAFSVISVYGVLEDEEVEVDVSI